MRVVDTRHEQTATFAAEGWAKLTRRPGLAALTAGPGITNGVSAITSALVQRFAAGRPRRPGAARALGRRLAAGARPRADRGVDHQVGGDGHGRRRRPARWSTPRRRWRSRPHRGPAFLDFPLDVFGPSPGELPVVDACDRPRRRHPTTMPWSPARRAARRRRAAGVHRRQRRVLGRRVGRAARAPSSSCGSRASSTASAAGCLPADHELAFLRTRGLLEAAADLVVVLGTPLDFRLGFGRFGDAQVAHVVDADVAARRSTSTCRPWPATCGWCCARSPTTPATGVDHERVDRRAARRRGRDARGRRGAARRRGRDPIKPSPDLRRARQAARARRGRDLRRRRLRLLRRQVRRGLRARLLARHRPVRLPGQRARLRARGPGRPPVAARSCCCSATAPPASA